MLTIVQPSPLWAFPDLRDLISYRDLLVFFVLRDIKVRYRQTLLGAGWAIVQPVLTMAMMLLIFRRLIGVPSDGVPYPLFCLSGLILWLYVSQAISASASSVLHNASLIENVWFPRLLIPVGAALASLLDLAISFALVIAALIVSGRMPGPAILLCVPLAACAVLFAASVGAALAALTVRFRDVGYLIPFGIQLMFFLTPVAYPASLVPEKWRLLLALNPAAGLVELFRWCLLRTSVNPWPAFGISLLTISAIVPLSLLVFRRMERSFADVI